MTKDQIQRLMFEAAKVTTFLEDDKIFYMASRKPDGSDELIEIEKFYISTEFMNNIIKQVVKECISVVEKEMNEAYGARGDGLADAIEMINRHFGVE